MSKPPPPCNWVVSVFGVKLCGKPSIGTIHKAGYCEEHAEKAQLFFGPMKMIVKETMFDEKELLRRRLKPLGKSHVDAD